MGQYIVLGIFLVLSIIFYSGKGSFLIAGFNTLPKENVVFWDLVWHLLCHYRWLPYYQARTI
ncbi:DUF3784 domain-containing protein [Salicibibacter kimchii]|uniref:DUF3784 domain-containing protein n=1 Tax=Salicibibacter kimchii TaxID=2099786 RepID=A0A345C1N4_9BACI|nr:DUF3784 domain-containing protein [Salicibibacter kimchii]